MIDKVSSSQHFGIFGYKKFNFNFTLLRHTIIFDFLKHKRKINCNRKNELNDFCSDVDGIER